MWQLCSCCVSRLTSGFRLHLRKLDFVNLNIISHVACRSNFSASETALPASLS